MLIYIRSDCGWRSLGREAAREGGRKERFVRVLSMPDTIHKPSNDTTE